MAFTSTQFIFIVISLFTVGCGFLVVVSRNLYHAALWLIATFFGVAALYAMLEAEFLAVAQVLIYIGAIATLIVFAIMLSRGMMMGRVKMSNFQWGVSAFTAGGIFILLVIVLLQINWPVIEDSVSPTAIADIGEALVNSYVVPFEVVSVLLLVALVGAIMIAREQ
ncbi:MAG: NADH-quinone oxidoreductase subunit J [Chloroflexota bacterium]|nr:NADH-quinone oxidoreductase subunit J [Chloroflexota bacterium]